MKNGIERKVKSKSKYKGVSEYYGDSNVWYAKLGKKQKWFNSEREAGKWVDLRLIERGSEPCNVLVRK